MSQDVNSKLFSIVFKLARESDRGTDALYYAVAAIEDYICARCAEACRAERADLGFRLGEAFAKLLDD